MNKTRLLCGNALIMLQLCSIPTYASDGKTLHEESCLGCHQHDLYQRDNRKVTTLSHLSTSVENCNTQLGTGWFPEDVQAVVRYLNTNFYKFKGK